MTTKIVPSLPKIKAYIGHIPQRLKNGHFENPRGRLEILRRIVTQLVREERVEIKRNRAVEARPYTERLLQLSITRGPDDEYTNKMLDWWLMEPHLKGKVFDELVPRLKDTDEPYTSLYSLPTMHITAYKDKNIQKPKKLSSVSLEINGHPFPSLQPLEDARLLLLRENFL
ncbi:unnamed protein product [Bursaphelenchus okinawaensis]|uniref:Large ribosomal subunit protein bL17m n=1 Tax=Bursaphelenchus okinawaensis TaxID=465554 RepID=A0A811KHX9_9BILA|nr:unnamed protein product [Bursaphelenchus okinawaensis]CAG9104968.1 unnamed protein product [Bursaphelenchus okinawaensis]